MTGRRLLPTEVKQAYYEQASRLARLLTVKDELEALASAIADLEV